MASQGKRLLIGCALGCGGLILLVVVSIIGFGIWLNSPGELLEPRRLLGADTTGFVEWRLDLEDPGTEGFVNALVEAIQTIPPEASGQVPPVLLNWLREMQRRETEDDLRELFPMVAAWTVRPGSSGGDDLHLWTLSIEKFGNRLVLGDWIMGWIFGRTAELEVERYRGEKIYRLPAGKNGRVTFFLRGADIFFTSDLDTARGAVDRLALAGMPERETTELDRLFDETADGGPLRGVISNENGELVRVWEWLSAASEAEADPAPWRDVRALSLTGGLEADGSLAARLTLHGPDAAWANDNGPALVMGLEQGLSWVRVPVELAGRPAGDRVEVELRLPELTDSVRHAIEHSDELETESGRKIRIDL